MVVTLHGEDTWKRILKESGIELGGGTFLIHKMYSDNETHNLMMTTSQTLGLDLNTCMETYGEFFYKYCLESGYDRVLKVLGNNLLDFLCNLDALHDHFDSAYPGMRAPSFRCNPTDGGGLLLHYYSERSGLYPMVVGIVKAVAKGLFETDVIIEPLNRLKIQNFPLLSTTPKTKICVTLSIREESPLGLSTRKRSSSLVSSLTRYRNSTRPKDLPLNVRTFCRAFPFHVMFNRSLEINQAGSSLLRLLQSRVPNGTKPHFSDLFSVVRPIMDFGFKAVLGHINTVFVVQTRDTFSTSLRLKGQMIFVPESDAILYLCSPRVSNLDDMKSSGLNLSDIPIHDSTRDLILVTQARKHERELVEKLEETSDNLKKLQTRLQEDKQKTDELLHSILPSNVADKLRLNQPVEAEKFALVSILFSDIVGFTAMCGDEKVVPIDIVRMLNRLYTQFDMLSSLNSVYKVETIGDAYMVVGGLPTPSDRHADNVVSMAFGMIIVSKTVLSPVDDLCIQIRIGIHSGPCVAGVVGQKMPRYCLFGNSVTIASKMESCGRPGKVNISEHAKSHLTNPDCYCFQENTTATDQVPCNSFFISQTTCSPKPLTMDLSLPVPRGMFRTPNPTPPGSLATTPCTSPQDVLSPIAPGYAHHLQRKAPAIHVFKADHETCLENAEEEIQRKLCSKQSHCFFNQEPHSGKWASNCIERTVVYAAKGTSSNGMDTHAKDSVRIKIPEMKLTIDTTDSDPVVVLPGQYDLTEKGIQEIEEMERRRNRNQDRKIQSLGGAPSSVYIKAPVLQISECDSLNRPVRPISPSLMSPPERFLTTDKIRRKSDSAMLDDVDSNMPSATSMRCIASCSSALSSERSTRSTGFLNGVNIKFTTKEIGDIRDRSKLTFYFRSTTHTLGRPRSSSRPTSL